jgi:TATA-box binding protein (TBP) (component of TFIID and TFIIIB)
MATTESQLQFTATRYKVSTITATGCVNTEICLQALFDKLELVPLSEAKRGFNYIEYGSNKSESFSRGEAIKRSRGRKQQSKTATGVSASIKRFDNQATAIFRVSENAEYFLNIKIFKNGNVQMTGIKSIEDGIDAINFFIEAIRSNPERGEIVSTPDTMTLTDYSIRLINSDFRVNFEIRRELLHKCLIEKYGNKSSYEPCIYPGVKLQYYWNKTNPKKDGICQCEDEQCGGKGAGLVEHDCKKTTIAIFQSGCIIITGASSMEQLEDSYEYICHVLEENMEYIRKKKFMLPNEQPAEPVINKTALGSFAFVMDKPKQAQKKILIKKSAIPNLHLVPKL